MAPLPAGRPCRDVLGYRLRRRLAACLRYLGSTPTPTACGSTSAAMLGLLHTLRTVKGLLIAIEIAVSSQLLPPVGQPRHLQRHFVISVLGPPTHAAGQQGQQGHGSTVQMLWLLLRRAYGSPAARKACDVLVWCCAHPVEELRPTTLALLSEALLPCALLEGLAAHPASHCCQVHRLSVCSRGTKCSRRAR
jgi:hypothetical protein